jgi:solute carrier family 20 (sodium-dependent phosphate transporter)
MVIAGWMILMNRYHLFLGPFLWRRGPVPWCPEEQRIVVQNYYRGHLTKEELAARDASVALYREATELGERMSTHISPKTAAVLPLTSEPPLSPGSTTVVSSPSSSTTSPMKSTAQESPSQTPSTSPQTRGTTFINHLKYTVWPTLKKFVLHGVDQDIVLLQQRDTRQSRTKRLEKMHSRAAHYDNQTEHLFSFLQVLTAATQSFAHG